MEQVEFVIPDRKDQLLEPMGDNRVFVEGTFPFSDLPSDEQKQFISDLYVRLIIPMDDTAPLIADKENLAKLYSVIDSVTNMCPSCRRELAGLLADGLEITRKDAELLEDRLRELDTDSQKEALKANYKASLKAWVYFVVSFLEDFDKSSEGEDAEEKVKKMLNSCKKGKRKIKRTKRRQATEGKEGFEDEEEDTTVDIERILSGLAKLAEKRIGCIWKEQLDEESYLKLYVKVVFSMLEKKEVLLNMEYRSVLKQILKGAIHSTKIDRRGLFQLISGKMVHMLYSVDGIDERMAELIVYCEHEDLTKEILLEVGKSLAKNDTTHETTGVKNISSFLEIVSERASKTLLTQLPSVIQLLDCEAYQLRNTAVAIMANIVALVFTVNEESDDADTRVRYDEQKMQIIKLLMMRTRDKNAFCRSKALTAMTELVDKNLINQTLHLDFLKISCNRIKDVASNVRRKAMQLLWKEIAVFSKAILKENVFLTNAELQAVIENNRKAFEEMDKAIMEKKLKEDPTKIEEDEDRKEPEEINEERQKYIATAEFYEIYEKFLAQIEEIVPSLTQLLGSKNGSDVVESIKVLTALYKRRVNSALAGIKKMIVLITAREKDNREQSIRKEILDSYTQIYFNSDTPSETKAHYLIMLALNSTASELACLEDFVAMLLQQSACPIEKEVFKYLWRTYVQQPSEGPRYEEQRAESRAALQLLTFASKVHQSLLEDKKKALMEHTLKAMQCSDVDWLLFREEIMAFQKATIVVEEDDVMFLNDVIKALIKYRNCTRKMEWFCAAEETINTIFALLDYPERHAEYIIHELSRPFVGSSSRSVPDSGVKENFPRGTALELANVLFVVGHVGMKMIIHAEKVEEEIRAKYRKASINKPKAKGDKAEDELDQVGGGKEAEIEKDLRELKAITERMLDKTNLLGSFIPVLLNLAKQTVMRYSGSIIQENTGDMYIVENIGINALCKLMYTSEKFCAEHIEKLFDLLRSNVDPIIKHNIIISLGDIANRFPNQMERWKQDIFDKLKDISAKVRRTTLMVLAHLILNDMLKVRGELAEICLMQDDSDDYIQSFVELFLFELNSKGPHIIYNALPKALAYISQHYPDLPFIRFEKVIRAMIKYVDKDKQAEQLIEKLCIKLKNSEEKQTDWINISYVLTQLSFSDKGLRKLLDLYDGWKDKVAENAQVKTHFLAILTKVKRPRADELGRNMIEELEIKLGVKEGEIKQQTSSSKKPKGKQIVRKRKQPRRKDRAAQELSIIQEENEEEEKATAAKEGEDKKDQEEGKSRKYYKATRRKKGGRNEQMTDIDSSAS